MDEGELAVCELVFQPEGHLTSKKKEKNKTNNTMTHFDDPYEGKKEKKLLYIPGGEF